MSAEGGPAPPIPNSYWVRPGRFAAGEYPGDFEPLDAAVKVRTLLEAGIDHFIDLTEERDGLEPYERIAHEQAHAMGRTVRYERHPIRDNSVPRNAGEMAAILDAIEDALDRGSTVYVHCWGGIGRTGTVVGCWLVRDGLTGEGALRQIAQWWQHVEKRSRCPVSPQTREQHDFVRTWTEPRHEPAPRSPVGEPTTRDRFRGCLTGLAAGDALGTTLEFKEPGSFDPIDDMVGGGPFRLRPGQWTDDTSMALCLATSLVEAGGFDPRDQMERYVRWWREGYLSSTGACFDIGNTVSDALRRFERSGDPYSGSNAPMSAGNGSLMRLAPVPMYFAGNAQEAIERAAASSRTTHGAPVAIDACRYFAGLLVGALDGVDKEVLLSEHYSPVEGLWEDQPLAPRIAAIADGSFKVKQPPEIRGTGYVVDSLEAVLWAFFHTGDFRDGALKVVNLGNDADTTGAIFGQIAGAHYGVESIPAEWRRSLTLESRITAIADSLHNAAPRI